MERGMRVLSLIAETRLPSLCTASSQVFPVNAFVLTHISRSATSIRRQIDAKIHPPWYKRGLMENAHLTLGRTCKVIPPSWYNGKGGGLGVDGLTFPTVFDMLQYFVKILHSLESIDLPYKVRYSLWVVALLEACDVTSNGRHLGCHLGFYHELEIR